MPAKAKAKSKGELAKEAKTKKTKHLKTAKGKKISKALKKYWKSIPKAKRVKRAKLAWKTRKRLYPPRGVKRTMVQGAKPARKRTPKKKSK